MAISRKKRIWGWMFFDWAQQPYATLGLTFIFAPYFAGVAAEYFAAQGQDEATADATAQMLWSAAQTVSGLIIALMAPLLGAWADASGRKMPWFYLFSAVSILCAAALWNLFPDGTGLYLTLVSFWLGFVAAEAAFGLANSILPSLGTPEEAGRISGSATAFGYWGGVLALAIMLVLFAEQDNGLTLTGQPPALGLDAEAREGTRLVGPVIALWFLVFMIPFFLWVHDDPADKRRAPPFRQVLSDLWATIRGLATRRSLAFFLLASMFYRDALSALYAYGGIYARLVLDWTTVQVGVFGIIAAIAAAILAWVGGLFDQRIGPKPVIVACGIILIGVCTIIVGMTRETLFGAAFGDWSTQLPLLGRLTTPDVIFYLCGIAIGGAGGVLYSSSRSLMVRHTDPARPAEAFGLFALTGRVTAFLAPALITLFLWITQSNNLAFLPVIGLFTVGLILLAFVHAEGDQPR